MQIKEYQSVAGIPIRPYTASFLAWRDLARKTGTRMILPENELCPFCGGWLSANNLEGYGQVWCICEILKRGSHLSLLHGRFASVTKERKLSELELWGDTDFRNAFGNLIAGMENWLLWPNKWITLLGSVGIGKTHILMALSQELKPWSLYITAGDFESKLFMAMNNKRDDGFTVEELISTVSHAPFLFLDDLGAEYGSKFPKATMRRVLDFRYSKPEEYVTVVASNLDPGELMMYDERMGDRLLDRHIGILVDMRYPESWRQHGNS